MAAQGREIDPGLTATALANIAPSEADYLDAALVIYSRFATPEQLDRIAVLVQSIHDVPGQMRMYRLTATAVLATRKRTPNAKTLWNATLAEAQTMGAPLVEALSLEYLGRIEEARQLYARCGADGQLIRLRSRARESMTPREVEVAALIVRGTSNRSIADALKISERTVEHHVAAILRKFDLSDRNSLSDRLRG
jgi:DNA-binding NarL/FixJ family response regulator